MARKKTLKSWVSDAGNTYTQENVDGLRKARDLLTSSLVWEDTEEDSDHWLSVYERLGVIADEIEKRVNGGFSAKL